VDLSVIIPIYDEEDCLPLLLEALDDALEPTGLDYEAIFVDDGSTDRSFSILDAASRNDSRRVVIRFRRNFGQTAAMQAGFDHARGDVVVTLDADLQNDPRDIPLLYDCVAEGYDLVAGWRKDRQDAFLSRKLPSRIANAIIGMTTKVKLHDYGCTLKAMRREVAKELRLYGEMHRFIPAVASWVGVSVLEVPVRHHPRRFGTSKYGIGRTTRVILDLITVRFLQGYLARPMQVFGLAGLISLTLGGMLCTALAAARFVNGTPLADRPLLLLGVLLVVVGIQLVSLGLVADVLAKTYYESQGKRPYYVRTLVRGQERTDVDDGPLPEPLGIPRAVAD
jgi:glycosyltransferase involved in cell wall biosynthesis